MALPNLALLREGLLWLYHVVIVIKGTLSVKLNLFLVEQLAAQRLSFKRGSQEGRGQKFRTR